jgi:pilus assembly protein TadC
MKRGMVITFPEVLFVVFLVLKLLGIINWSWWWVTAPLWISIGLGIALFGIILIIASIITASQILRKRNK